MKIDAFRILPVLAVFILSTLNRCEKELNNPSQDVEIVKDKIAFISDLDGKRVIYTMSIDGLGLNNMAESFTSVSTPRWSPNGEYIAFSGLKANNLNQIFLVKFDKSNLIQLTEDETGAINPAWSLDGKQILFLTKRDEMLSTNRKVPAEEIYVINVDGSQQRRITNNQNFEHLFDWSPTGEALVVSANVAIPFGYDIERIYLINLQGVIQKQLTDIGYNNQPRWSPDGNLIVFTSSRNDCSGIFTMKADGSQQTCIVKDILATESSTAVQNINPAWSPDGKHIIFSSNLDGDFDLYTVEVDGSNLKQITDMLGDETFPDWSAEP